MGVGSGEELNTTKMKYKVISLHSTKNYFLGEGPGYVMSLMSTEHCTSSIFANYELNFDIIDNGSDIDKFH